MVVLLVLGEIHEPILRIKPKLLKNLIYPYFIFFLSIVLLIIGFTSIIELLHAFKSTKKEHVIYWFSVSHKSIFVWIICIIMLFAGLAAVKKSFKFVKEKWDEVMDEIKLSFMK